MGSFFAELKRRNVFKVGVAYAIVAWLLIEIVATVFPLLTLPDWSARLITVVILIGFPIAVFLAWAYELTPEGIKTTSTVDRSQHIPSTTGQRFLMMKLVENTNEGSQVPTRKTSLVVVDNWFEELKRLAPSAK